MNRAWMPIVPVITLGLFGCQGNPLQKNEPVVARYPDSYYEQEPGRARLAQPPRNERPVSEANLVAPPVAQQIESYVGQFPSHDPSPRNTGAVSAAGPSQGRSPALTRMEPPAEQRSSTVSSPPPAAGTAARPAAPSSGNAAMAPAAGTTSVQANQAVTQDQMASPQPPRIADRQMKIELIDVSPASPTAAQAAGPESSVSANRSVDGIKTAEADSLSGLIRQLEASVQANPNQLDDVLRLALLYLATGQDAKAGDCMKQVDPIRGDLVSAVVQTVSTSREAVRTPGSPAPAALLAAEHLRNLLAQRSPVMIPKIAMVTSVQSFGVYQAVTPARFPAGQPVHVFLYTEVANFRSEPAGDGRLQTRLGARLEVYDSAGKVVWQQNHADIRDVVQTPRHDFFVPLEIKLPATTPAGEYTLKVTIEDKIGATADQRRMTFTIGAP